MDTPTPNTTHTSSVNNPTPPPSRWPKKKIAILCAAVILVIAAISGVVFALTRSNDKKNSPPAATTTSKPDVITSSALQCVPRGHDYYRTNNTLAIDPDKPDTLYVGVEYKGVYKSTDGGKSWQASDKGIRGYAKEADTSKKCVQELGRTVIDPRNPQHLLLSRVESPSTLQMIFGETAGLYESFDGGSSWKQNITANMNASGSRAIAFDPKDSSTIYYGINNMKPSFKSNNEQDNRLFNTKGILYKTTDGAKSWQELPTGADEGFRAMSIAIDQQNGQNVWLGTFNQDTQGGQSGTQKGILKTTDGGQTWKSYPFKNALADMDVAKHNFKHVYASLQTMSGAPEAYYTLDGETFQKADSHPYILVGRYDPYDTTGMRMLGYAPYGDSLGLYESTNGGKSWNKYAATPKEATGQGSREFGSIAISDIVWHPTDKNIIYMNGSGASVWKSTDGGKNWTTIMNLDTIGGPNKNKADSTKSSEADQ